MKVRKKGYWVLLAFTLVLALVALTTLMPAVDVSENCLLGYKAVCSFTPISTILLALFAGMICFIRKRFFVSYK